MGWYVVLVSGMCCATEAYVRQARLRYTLLNQKGENVVIIGANDWVSTFVFLFFFFCFLVFVLVNLMLGARVIL